MSEPELEGRGLSTSRRKFIWLGGGIAASLLLFPDFSLAAKASKAVKRVATGKSSKPATKSSAAAASKAKASASKGKSAAKSNASASKTSRSASKAGKATASRSSAAARKARTASASRNTRNARDVARSRTTTARAAIDPAAELELPSSYAPGRAFSFGAGSGESRDLSLYCVHTGERLNVDYYVGGRYEPEAMRAIDHLLRDYHNGEICQFDPRVLNQLYDVRRALGSNEPFHVFSGYRSPATNESYRRHSGRVAEHSYHLTGQAIDIELPGRDIRQIRNVAVAMRGGGVGYYPSDGFVHLDSGPVRRW